MGAVADFVGDVIESVGDVVEDVVDAVGDVVETVGDVVSDVVEFVGDTVEKVLEDPLPVILQIAGAAVGIPPMVTSAVITASRGGDLGDIALSVGTAYLAPTATNAISSTLSSTIGDAIVNETISNTVVEGVSKGLVNGTISEIRGGDFEDGFAGGFTGSVVGAGVSEVADFVKPEIADAVSDLGLDQSTINQISSAGTKAITAGLTAEITGRGDFATAFTNSVVNSTANTTANLVTNSITDQFQSVETVDRQITGAQDGNTKDQEELKTELADAWANRDVNTVNDLLTNNQISADDARTMFDLTDDDMTMLTSNGLNFYNAEDTDIKTTTSLTSSDDNSTVGTGAGIPDTLVEEVETTLGGNDTGTATNVVENTDTTYYSNDLGGTDSVATVSGSNTQSTQGATEDTVSDSNTSWLDLSTSGYSDVSDIAETVDVARDESTGVPEDFQDLTVADTSTAPVGGLTAVTQAATNDGDVLFEEGKATPSSTEAVTDTSVDETVAQKPVDVQDVLSGQGVTAVTEEGEKPADVAGGLNKLSDAASKAGVAAATGVAGAVTSGLKSALKSGITQSVKGALTKPVLKTATRKVPVKTAAPTKLSATQLASLAKKTPAPTKVDVSTLKPVASTTTAPKKVDVSKLTPVTNIASLTSLIGNKG